jgi:hypothetical protein
MRAQPRLVSRKVLAGRAAANGITRRKSIAPGSRFFHHSINRTIMDLSNETILATVTPDWVRQQMNAKGMNQGELAKAIGEPQPSLSEIIKPNPNRNRKYTQLRKILYLYFLTK